MDKGIGSCHSIALRAALCANIDETPASPFINVEGMEAGNDGTSGRRTEG
jgi:hypothetical protein